MNTYSFSIISIVLVVPAILLLPSAVWATGTYDGGDGSQANPFQINTPAQMDEIGQHSEDWASHFILTADIDLSGYTGTAFNIIGTDYYNQFTGSFDGNGHTISNFTYTSTGMIGLFGYVVNGHIENLGLVNTNVNAGSGNKVGALVGWNRGTVSNCYATGSVTVIGGVGNWMVGGLVGWNNPTTVPNSGTVTNCYATVIVSGTQSVGGLVGSNHGTVSNCYATGTVTGPVYATRMGGLVGSNSFGTVSNCYATGSVMGDYCVGGLVGAIWEGTVSNCYATGSVTGGDYNLGEYVGGLVGENYHGTISNCYAIGTVTGPEYASRLGGLVGGSSLATVTTSFWDIDTSGQATSAGGTGKTTAQMQTQSTFTNYGWDFVGETANGTEDIWRMLDYVVDYPILSWELPPVADAGDSQTVHAGMVVTLDGSGSSDPDEDYPLTYWWQITSRPEGSIAELSDPCAVNPSFFVDILGDYSIELVVTDSRGLQSAPDSVHMRTFNTSPIPDSGDDQAIIELGSTVQLDASQSYDDDGDDITYFWTITEKPEGSLAVLDDPCSATPTFIADVQGDYVISLIVTDTFGAESEPQTVTVSFANVKPVADAGGNQSVIAGDTVFLDGSASYDANFDLLSYSWSFVSVPVGSLAQIADPTSVETNFVADEPGAYVVSLVVNDGFVDSDPANVTIMAITTEEATAITLVETVETVNLLDTESLKNKNLSNALTNKINAALEMIDQGFYQDALDKLVHDILQKTNGCADTGEPDRNDWITTCEEQGQVYPLIIEAVELLENLI